MSSFSRWLLVGAAVTSSLINVAKSQTIENTHGNVVDANGSNVEPAAESVSGGNLVLTDDVLSNLTDHHLSDIELFYFEETDTKSINRRNAKTPRCKTMPGDASYPSEKVWGVLDLLTGGDTLLKPAPLGAACYPDHPNYDAEKCEYLLANWSYSATHINHPTSVMSPLFQGSTCQPQNGGGEGNSTCTVGGFPLYSIKATQPYHVQLAVNLARNLNLRLVIHNTGHDFLGKSTGEGALSIWTRHMTEIQVLENYVSPDQKYSGPAFRIGAGVQVGDLYAAAEREGYTAVGGECHNVGVSGGYSAGGGHSPVSPLFGLGSDQILSVDMVLASGRFVTVDAKSDPDLFWALRGGGAATWGVVTSMTVKVHPKMRFSGMSWSVSTGPEGLNISEETFWKGIEAYWRGYPEYSEKGKSYGYMWIFPAGDGTYAWSMNPWMVPNMSLEGFKEMVRPLLREWEDLGIFVDNLKPDFFEYDRFYPAWKNHFPTESIGTDTGRSGSRLIPRKNWEDEGILNDTMAVLKDIGLEGGSLILYNINAAAPEGETVDSTSANPAWRDAVMFAITGYTWDEGISDGERNRLSHEFTYGRMQKLKDVTPGAGGYGNEGDVMDPEFQQSFWGHHYERLYAMKQKVDPRGVFYAPTAVGSEDWYITGQYQWLETQVGRLCRRED